MEASQLKEEMEQAAKDAPHLRLTVITPGEDGEAEFFTAGAGNEHHARFRQLSVDAGQLLPPGDEPDPGKRWCLSLAAMQRPEPEELPGWGLTDSERIVIENPFRWSVMLLNRLAEGTAPTLRRRRKRRKPAEYLLEVMPLKTSNPSMTLEQAAEKLEIATSTMTRHYEKDKTFRQAWDAIERVDMPPSTDTTPSNPSRSNWIAGLKKRDDNE